MFAQSETVQSLLWFYVLAVPACIVYFLPSFVAWRRGHHNGNTIGIINIFLGWTFIGWVVALAMAFSHIPED